MMYIHKMFYRFIPLGIGLEVQYGMYGLMYFKKVIK